MLLRGPQIAFSAAKQLHPAAMPERVGMKTRNAGTLPKLPDDLPEAIAAHPLLARMVPG